jgi:cellulose 1,4-beta-cellobiosidase
MDQVTGQGDDLMLSRHAAPLLVLGVIVALAAPLSRASTSLASTSLARKAPHTTRIFQQLGWTPVTTPLGGRYIVRNDNFAGRTECLRNASLGPNFTVASSAANSRGPESDAYPDVFYGCSWGLCTHGSVLPARLSQVREARASSSIDDRAGGRWSTAFDIWFGRHRSGYRAQATGAELMIWLDAHDFPPPPGPRLTVDHRRWYLYHWVGRLDGKRWNYIQVRAVRPVTQVRKLELLPVIDHLVGMGLIRRHWWMLNVESGFEIWSGGTGLAMKSFSAHVRI